MVSITNGRGDVRVSQSGATQSVSLQTVVQDATELAVPVESNRRYTVRGFIPFTLAGALSGWKFKIPLPLGNLVQPTMTVCIEVLDLVTGAGSVVAAGLSTGATTFAGALALGNHMCRVTGHLEMGDIDDVLKFQFSQNVSDAAAIAIRRGSYLECTYFG